MPSTEHCTNRLLLFFGDLIFGHSRVLSKITNINFRALHCQFKLDSLSLPLVYQPHCEPPHLSNLSRCACSRRRLSTHVSPDKNTTSCDEMCMHRGSLHDTLVISDRAKSATHGYVHTGSFCMHELFFDIVRTCQMVRGHISIEVSHNCVSETIANRHADVTHSS